MERRQFVALVAAMPTVASAGCLDALEPFGTGSPPDPIDLGDGKFDDHHGMEIGPHGGANGQIFYEDAAPTDRDEDPFWFHTLAHSLFPFHFDRLEMGWTPEVIYVTDFSTVDVTIEERDVGPTMPSPTAAETFADATTLSYVVESDVMGGMGPDLHPFSESMDATAFAEAHGGQVIDYEAITPEVVAMIRSGGAPDDG